MHFYPELIDEDTLFDELQDAGLSLGKSEDGQELTLKSINKDNNITSRLLDMLTKVYGARQSKVVCVCFNVAVESTARKFAIKPNNTLNANMKIRNAMKNIKVNSSPPTGR